MAKVTFVPDPQSTSPEKPFILSYLGMRQIDGWVGVILPVAVALGNWPCSHALEGSISAYYFTRMVGWFAGSLWVIGFFMVSCRGYDKWDELSGRLAGIFALGVALIPMNIREVKEGRVGPICASISALVVDDIKSTGGAPLLTLFEKWLPDSAQFGFFCVRGTFAVPRRNQKPR